MTWRYSAKHEEVRQARNLVSEEWLLEILNKMTEEVRYPNYRAEFCDCIMTRPSSWSFMENLCLVGISLHVFERFSFEHHVTRLAEKNSSYFFIQSEVKPKPVFPRLASATCNYFELSLVHCVFCVRCDWLELSPWFWFYDTHLKPAVKVIWALREKFMKFMSGVPAQEWSSFRDV